MKNLLFILALLVLPEITYSQDTIKTGRPIIQIQGYPDTTTSIVHGIIADTKNVIWFKIHALEQADPSVKYFIKEKNGNAIIQADKNNKNGFYIIPIGKKLKKLSVPIIELEVWVSFKKNNLFYPIRKSPDLPYSADRSGKIIEANILWKNYKESMDISEGKILIGSDSFKVTFQ